MASSASTPRRSPESPGRIPKAPNMFTSDGYVQIFGACDHAADVFGKLVRVFTDDLNVDIWLQELRGRYDEGKAQVLFDFWKTLEKKKATMKQHDCLRYIQIFLLLENVFRNAVLRPHIPAYRAINKHSGRYRCFVKDSEKRLFEKLQFSERDPDFLVYENGDLSQTIIYAITCNIFWHVLKMQLAQNPQ